MAAFALAVGIGIASGVSAGLFVRHILGAGEFWQGAVVAWASMVAAVVVLG